MNWQPGDRALLRLDAETEIPVTRTEYGDWIGAKGTRYDPALPAALAPSALAATEDHT